MTPGTHRRIRVMLVDDHPLVRSAIRQAIDAPDVELVGEAGSAEDAYEIAIRTRPDVVLTDIGLPGASGVHLVRELVPRLPETRFVMLTVSSADDDVLEAIEFGASGYLTKDLTPDALLRAVRGAYAGDDVEERGLPGAVGSDDTGDAPVADVEADSVEGVEAAKALPHAPDGEEGVTGQRCRHS